MSTVLPTMLRTAEDPVLGTGCYNSVYDHFNERPKHGTCSCGRWTCTQVWRESPNPCYCHQPSSGGWVCEGCIDKLSFKQLKLVHSPDTQIMERVKSKIQEQREQIIRQINEDRVKALAKMAQREKRARELSGYDEFLLMFRMPTTALPPCPPFVTEIFSEISKFQWGRSKKLQKIVWGVVCELNMLETSECCEMKEIPNDVMSRLPHLLTHEKYVKIANMLALFSAIVSRPDTEDIGTWITEKAKNITSGVRTHYFFYP